MWLLADTEVLKPGGVSYVFKLDIVSELFSHYLRVSSSFDPSSFHLQFISLKEGSVVPDLRRFFS